MPSAVKKNSWRQDKMHIELLFLPLYRPWTIKYTQLYVKMPVFASILVNTVGLKWQQTAEKEKHMCNSILDPGSS